MAGLRVLVLAYLGAVALCAPLRPKQTSLLKAKSGAPAGAPGGAPGAAPAASPAAPTDKWGADSHAEEFGNEYVHHTREGLKEPHVGDAVWQSEMHSNPADFDPHGQDFLTDARSPAKPMMPFGAAGHVGAGLVTALVP